MCKSHYEQNTIDIQNRAYKFYCHALIGGHLAQIICVGALCWWFECKEISLDETCQIILLICAIAVIFYTTISFIRKAERDYEIKRNHHLSEQRKINRERFIEAFAEELYKLQQSTQKEDNLANGKGKNPKKSDNTRKYSDLSEHEKGPYRHLAENAIIKAGY